MPVALWGDVDGSRLTETYFSKHDGVWSHGDWVTFHEDLSCVITGRSDATLNRGGVRLGTSDFYTVVDQLPEVEDSVVVHLEDAGNGELVLLIATPGETASDALEQRLRRAIREAVAASRARPGHPPGPPAAHPHRQETRATHQEHPSGPGAGRGRQSRERHVVRRPRCDLRSCQARQPRQPQRCTARR
ncbi:hypothetical protein [Aeromicrobium sp. UC242_57]|uniref:hypothetical protein n=1 Tax=Aeromicrobium sp. UC242_57 TaxID=3374624 RepID=UPI0037A95B22